MESTSAKYNINNVISLILDTIVAFILTSTWITYYILVSLKFFACDDALVKQRFQYLHNKLTLDAWTTTRLLPKVVTVASS